MTSPGLRALRARKRRHLPAGGTRGTSPAPAASPTMHGTTNQVAPCTQATEHEPLWNEPGPGPWEQEISREPTPRRRGVYPISICGCWWIVDRPSPCPSHTNPR